MIRVRLLNFRFVKSDVFAPLNKLFLRPQDDIKLKRSEYSPINDITWDSQLFVIIVTWRYYH